MYIIEPKHFCDESCNEKLLDREISLVFQKIISTSSKSSFEVLSRVGNDFESPEPILKSTCINNMRDFDYRVFDLIFSEFDKYIEKYGSVHINIFPFTLREHNFIGNLNLYLKKYNIKKVSKIYFEIIENGYIKECTNGKLELRHKLILENLNSNILELQKLGIKVGLDDYPKGNTKVLLKKLKNLDFVKIDKGILLDNNIVNKKWKVMELINEIKKIHTNAEIIIEGVETKEDKKLLDDIGGLSMQGYYFGKPEKDIG